MSEPVIKLDHLSKSFGNVHAVHDLSLQIEAGTIFGFLGANGAGKTTTIRMLQQSRATMFGKIDNRLGRSSATFRNALAFTAISPYWRTSAFSAARMEFRVRNWSGGSSACFG